MVRLSSSTSLPSFLLELHADSCSRALAVGPFGRHTRLPAHPVVPVCDGAQPARRLRRSGPSLSSLPSAARCSGTTRSLVELVVTNPSRSRCRRWCGLPSLSIALCAPSLPSLSPSSSSLSCRIRILSRSPLGVDLSLHDAAQCAAARLARRCSLTDGAGCNFTREEVPSLSLLAGMLLCFYCTFCPAHCELSKSARASRRAARASEKGATGRLRPCARDRQLRAILRKVRGGGRQELGPFSALARSRARPPAGASAD